MRCGRRWRTLLEAEAGVEVVMVEVVPATAGIGRLVGHGQTRGAGAVGDPSVGAEGRMSALDQRPNLAINTNDPQRRMFGEDCEEERSTPRVE